MADRRPVGEKEFNPLDESMGLISQVISGQGARAQSALPESLKAKQETPLRNVERVVELKKAPAPVVQPVAVSPDPQEGVQREEFVVCKFSVPRADYMAAKKIVAALEGELGSRIDLSNLGRGWLTRLVTAEKEIFEAAKHQQKLRTPNSRDPLQVAEVDHAMAVVQSVAFRRAEPIR